MTTPKDIFDVIDDLHKAMARYDEAFSPSELGALAREIIKGCCTMEEAIKRYETRIAAEDEKIFEEAMKRFDEDCAAGLAMETCFVCGEEVSRSDMVELKSFVKDRKDELVCRACDATLDEEEAKFGGTRILHDEPVDVAECKYCGMKLTTLESFVGVCESCSESVELEMKRCELCGILFFKSELKSIPESVIEGETFPAVLICRECDRSLIKEAKEEFGIDIKEAVAFEFVGDSESWDKAMGETK